ncbi:MAG: three-Cys-motif partner protein TcmP [Candidatus Geothermarchaeales archaeon]
MAEEVEVRVGEMPDRLPTVWPIDPHTEAKHFILRRHLGAWFPILSKWNQRIIYLDGFAGPGRYAGGEDGSPVIAIRTAAEHVVPLAREILFYFIEVRPDRKEHLEKLLVEEFPDPPPNIRWIVSGAEFADEMREVLDELEGEGLRLAPTFAFLDPFGFKGMPVEIVSRLLRHERCEAFITFMEKFINRFSQTELHEEALDELFGTPEWRKVRRLSDPEARRSFLLGLYTAELRKRVPNLLVRTFEMVDASNQVLYYLVFATKSAKGVGVMKEAMWAVDRTGSYRFSDRTDPAQKTLLDIEDEAAWIGPAARVIHAKFREKLVSVSEVERFVVVETPFLFRKKILKRLEEDGKIADVIGRKRRRTFPDGCLIQFI